MSDKIIVRKLKVFGYHGATERERTEGQNFYVDLEIKADLRKGAKSDRLKKTLDYADVIPAVQKVIADERYNLLETLAEHIAQVVLGFKKAESVKVRVAKKGVPEGIDVKSVAVEIKRSRK